MNHSDEAALASRDWSGAEVEPPSRPRPASVVHSVRMPQALTERLFAEAARRGVTPSDVIRDLVEAGLSDVENSATVRLADVHRILNRLASEVA